MYFITTVLLNFRIYTFFKIFKLYRSVKSGSPPTHTSFIYISSRKVRDKRQQQIRLILLCFGGCVTKSNSVFISVHFQFCSHQTLVSHSFHSFPFWDDTLLLIGSFHSSFCLLSNLNKHSTVPGLSLTFLNTHVHPSCALGVLGNAQICGQNFFMGRKETLRWIILFGITIGISANVRNLRPLSSGSWSLHV